VRIDCVYICTKAGQRLFSKFYKGSQIDPSLFSGMISAISSFSQEATGESVKEFKLENISIFIKDFGIIFVVIISDFIKDVEKLLDMIGMKFIATYITKLRDWKGNVGLFTDFESILEEEIFGEQLVGLYTDKKKTTSQVLDILEILNLPKELQETVFALLALKESTTYQIAKKINTTIAMGYRNLERLVELGYIGKKKKKGLNFYFI